MDDSGLGGGSSSGGFTNPFGDGGLGMMATFNCHSPADCTEGGPGQSCCFTMATYTTNCQAGPCAGFTQCATNADCPGGGQCTPSPLSMVDHYCGRHRPRRGRLEVGRGWLRRGGAEAGGSEGGGAEAPRRPSPDHPRPEPPTAPATDQVASARVSATKRSIREWTFTFR